MKEVLVLKEVGAIVCVITCHCAYILVYFRLGQLKWQGKRQICARVPRV